MPVVLSQHFLSSDRRYQDAEFSLYHYPKVYFSRVQAYDRFIYYRPLGESRPRHDSRQYFGFGRLGHLMVTPSSTSSRPQHFKNGLERITNAFSTSSNEKYFGSEA